MGIPPVAPAVRKTAFYPPFRPFFGGGARSNVSSQANDRAQNRKRKVAIS
jgi:hypothetical protein